MYWFNSMIMLAEGLDLLLLGIVVFHVWMAPYTKVEESFNIQVGHFQAYKEESVV
jgi:alpha-1,6-mannosyltransferase